MLVLTPVPAHTASYGYRVPSSNLYSEVDYFDAVAERAARDYAEAQARLQAIERRRVQIERQRQVEEASRRQIALDRYYREQSRLIAASVRTSSYPRPRQASSCAIEELSYSVRREEERRHVLLARQREAERLRVRGQDHRERARPQAQRDRVEFEVTLDELFGAPARVPLAPYTQQSRAHALRPTSSQRPASPQVRTASHEDGVTDDQFAAAMQDFLVKLTAAPATPATPEPVDRKGKGKAVDVPIQSAPAPAPAPPSQTGGGPSFKEELEARMRTETDPEIQESLVKLYSDIFDAPQPTSSQPVPGPSAPTRGRTTSPAPSTTTQATERQSPAPTESSTAAEGAHLHRTPALPPTVAEKLLKFYHARRARKLSLAQIAAVEDALRKLEGTFAFPERLDFVHPLPSEPATPVSEGSEEGGKLAYTANNTPLHAYEHALNGLLTQLDAVESNGDAAVRGRRKAVVQEVERALEAIERRVEESRERERERSRERARSSAPSTPVSEAAPAIEVEAPAEDKVEEEDKPDAEAVRNPITDAPEADTVSVELVNTPTPSDSAPTSPVDATPARSAPSPAVDSAPSAPGDLGVEAPLPHDVVEAPEADTVSVSLVDLPTSEDQEAITANSTATIEPSAPAPHAAEALQDSQPEAQEPDTVYPQSEATPDEPPAPSSVAFSEPLDVTSATAPSTLPPRSVPTPMAITRETSSDTDATFVTADPAEDASSLSSSSPTSEPMTRQQSQASFSAEETFLLATTPLADAPKKSRPQASEEDEPEFISKDEVAHLKSDSMSDWSDVEA
ncbi:hypothetical protein BD413DRAFT_544491 [Trametes elegans]|nr:hypothetical protein BD413DRAFT_544491 [Trametes elegans]